MKKCVILLMSILLISACASARKKNVVQKPPEIDWHGKHIEEFIKSKGLPTSQYSLSDGQTAYSFKIDCQYDAKIGEALVIVGKDKLITDISYPIKCPAYQNSISYTLDIINDNIIHVSRQISSM